MVYQKKYNSKKTCDFWYTKNKRDMTRLHTKTIEFGRRESAGGRKLLMQILAYIKQKNHHL